MPARRRHRDHPPPSPTGTPGSPWPTRPRRSSWPRWTARSSSSPCRRSSAASTSTRWRPGNITYLLWMIMGYRLVQAVLVVNLGRLGDMFGRVRMYNQGFVVFTVASILLSFDPFQGSGGALWLIGWRFLQAIGGVDADGQLGGDPHRRLPARTPRLRPRHQPDRRAGRHVHRPGRSAACSPPGTGGRCSGSTCRSACSARCGPTCGCATTANGTAARSTGGATSRSRSASARSSSASPTASSPITATRWAGRARWCSAS